MKKISLKPITFLFIFLIFTFSFVQLFFINDTVFSEVYETITDEVYEFTDEVNHVAGEVYQVDENEVVRVPNSDQPLVAKDLRRGGMVELIWEPSTNTGVVGYMVYRTEQTGEIIQVNETFIDTTQYIETGLVDEQEYVYRVEAVDDFGSRFLIGEVSVVPTLDVTPPPVPGALVVQDPGTGKKIDLQWPPVEAGDLAGYNLYRQYKEIWQKINAQPMTDCTFTDTAIVNGTVYHYRVSSIDDLGNESLPTEPVICWATNQNARIVWQFGETGQDGTDLKHLFAPGGVSSNGAGTYFVADTHNGRTLEISDSGEVTGADLGMSEPSRIKPVNENELLIVDSCSSQVMLIDRILKQTIWSYGLGKKKHGKGSGQLNNPTDATVLSNGNILIADTGNSRLLEVNRKGRVVWDSNKKSFNCNLYLPVSVQSLENGNILVTDAGLNQVLEVTKEGDVVWSFGTGQSGNKEDQLDYPTDSIRLDNENTMIIDSLNYRILEISKEGYFIWQFGERDQPDGLFEPAGIAWLPNNHILIADQHNHRIVEIDH